MSTHLPSRIVRVLLCGVCWSLWSQQGFSQVDLPGTWNLVSFNTPSDLPITSNGGLVSGITNLDHFEIGTGSIHIATNLTFSGSLDGSLSGSVTIGAETGQVNLISDDDIPSVYWMDHGGDFMVGVASSAGFQEILILIKRPDTAPVLSTLSGQWNVLGFDTPSTTSLQPTTVGNPPNQDVLTGLTNKEKFTIYTGQIEVGPSGQFSGQFDGSVSGSIALSDPGSVSITVSGEGTFPLFVNRKADLMVTVINDGPYQELLFLLRAPANASANVLAGDWSTVWFYTPDELILNHLNQMVTDVINANNFSFGTGRSHFTAFGHVTGTLDGPLNAKIATITAGRITQQFIDEGDTQTLFVNASHTLLAGVSEEPGFQEIMLMPRVQPSMEIELFGLGFGQVLKWVPATNRVLTTSINLVDWELVGGDPGSGCYTNNLPGGNRFFRFEDR